MKRTIHVKSKKKTLRPAARKQQIMRKEERKQAKHRQVIYVSAAVPRCRNRGAQMPRTDYSPCVLVDTSNLPEAEWLEWRRKGIGGSDAAAILGISPFATARDLYYDKLKILPFEEGEDNWVAKKMGHLLEDDMIPLK